MPQLVALKPTAENADTTLPDPSGTARFLLLLLTAVASGSRS